MTTAKRGARRLPKPRKALVIIEAAALTTAVVLLGWLSLWLIHQHARGLRVEAFYLAEERTPFQEADARALVGSERAAVRVANADALSADVREASHRTGAPIVVSVSDPAIEPDGNPDAEPDALVALVKGVVAEAECDVLLAVDMAQVDSDRELGVYANAPYHGLAEKLRGLTAGEHVVYVMTSAAPAQKSWTSEALGRSVFAHFLREGLAGGARGWDQDEIPGRISVEGLYRYVRDHVELWARDHRGSIQTPMLLRVGEARRPITFAYAPKPAAVVRDAGTEVPAGDDAVTARKEDEPRKEGTAAAPKPLPPREDLLIQLSTEWKAHEALLERTPYRMHPEAFRAYQSTLVNAECRLRNGWAGAASLDPVREALAAAVKSREQLVRDLDEDAARTAKASPFRPARSEEAGRIAVTQALTFLTGTGPDDRELFAAPSPAPKPNAEKKDGERPEAASPSRSTDPPPALDLAAARGLPERFLELQLPAWGLKYVQEFRVPDYFKTERRGAVLKRLVEVRARAEDALAADARGLDWIRPVIETGDEDRRRLQDQLFSPGQSAGDSGRALIEGVLPIREAYYEKAHRFMRTYQEGRATWERVAAELPDVAEYAVRALPRTPDAVSLPDHPLPSEVEQALKDAESLVLALDHVVPSQGADPQAMQERLDAIRDADQRARASLEVLEKAAARPRDRDWTAIDAALRTPWIPASARPGLIRKALELGGTVRAEPSRAETAAADPPAADPNFWALAGGLAALDERLREIAAGPDAHDADRRSIDEGWKVARTAPTEAESAALSAFHHYSVKSRTPLGRRFRRGRGEPLKAKELHAILQADDRIVRLARRGESRAEGLEDDAAVASWIDLATSRLLTFQADRLHKDYVAAAPDLVLEAVALARRVGAEEPRDPFAGSLSLALRTEPPAHSLLRIDAEGKAEMQVGLTRSEDEDQADRIPAGQAFVGVAAPPVGLSISGEAPGPPYGTLAAVPFVGGPRTRLVVRQIDPETPADKLELVAAAFYRGRVDQSATTQVVVVPQKFPDPVVRIAYDPEALKHKYGELGEDAVSRIEDQFRRHPNEGYMHRGKSATYRLHFSNPTFQEIAVVYKRKLVASGGGEPLPVDDEEKTLRVPPGGSASVPGEVTSDQVPLEKARELVVEWRIADKKPMPPLKVRFQQIEASRYMTFTPSIGFPVTAKDRAESFIVVGRRRLDDPVCEPILGREIHMTIEGQPKGMAPLAVIERGAAFELMLERPPGATSFKWSAEIENDRFPVVEFNAR